MMRGMKTVSEELRYDGATLEQVHGMLADKAFRGNVCARQHVLRHTVRVDRSGQAMTVEVDQVQGARGIPSFAKKLVGEEIRIVQTEDWASPEKGNIALAIPGKPTEMSGTILLTQDPDGTTETVNLTVRVGIPLVGGKIEGLITDMLGRALRVEHEVGVQWLAGQR